MLPRKKKENRKTGIGAMICPSCKSDNIKLNDGDYERHYQCEKCKIHFSMFAKCTRCGKDFSNKGCEDPLCPSTGYYFEPY